MLAGSSVECWIGIGSNLGDPVGQVRDSFDALDAMPGTTLMQTSGLYRTAPMGPPDQPDYINAVAKLETCLAPKVLLDAMQAIERAAGRVRTIKWGPRILDLDLLTYGDQCLDEAGLQVPHPGIRDRNFVLLPLLSVAPDLEIPGLGCVRQLAAATGDEGIVRLD